MVFAIRQTPFDALDPAGDTSLGGNELADL